MIDPKEIVIITDVEVEEIPATAKLRYFDRRREDNATLFWIIPLGKFHRKYGAVRNGESIVSRTFNSQKEAIAEIARRFNDHPLGIEIDFEIVGE